MQTMRKRQRVISIQFQIRQRARAETDETLKNVPDISEYTDYHDQSLELSIRPNMLDIYIYWVYIYYFLFF